MNLLLNDKDKNKMSALLEKGSEGRHPKELEEGESERFLNPDPIEGDTFDSTQFTMLVMAQDSVTLVTSL